ncbi:hypothetical protein [Levilactobacillus tujiorum]|uniref:SMODS-associating 2TM beta-strand rich effector domain-containing protein n=1 Tax=Levilactobacillus tujiorum TaxID=2912243 RepID=A0ABX1L531_9LACO|nr:hypothetical protein [Levilactobacillus tujiorum]MCH5465193.1 hypothetical protein [Levilactobacillus tujiorum]NLR12183.1 hypothetical protein [Lactobacillus sp. HBUAS51387]NLR30146.1 hypothetical protein [Levilactobacillus tujiorum]
MKFRLRKIHFQETLGMILWVITVILLSVSQYCKWTKSITPILTVVISLISALIMFLLNRENDTITRIDGVKPIWKLLSIDSKIEFFSLDKSKSVLDNVRYYSIICDCEHNVKAINTLSNTKGEEIETFYFTPNAVVESEKVYSLKESSLIKESSNTVFMSLDEYKNIHKNEENIQNYKQLVVIKATTIFSDNTYFFEGDGLSGGICETKGKYEPYSGNLSNKDLMMLVKSYVEKINKHFLKGNSNLKSKTLDN